MSFSASPLPNAKKTFLDANGAPLAGGSVGYYVPSTLNAKTTWADENQATPNPTVITLDAAGRPQTQVFGSGDYREIVKDINGNTIWDAVTNVPAVGTGVTGTELITTGNVVAGAWTTFGIRVQLQSATYTDTTSSGTIPVVVVDANNAPTIAASNATTYTNAYTQYVSAPTAGANVTFTASWALGVDSLYLPSTGTISAPDGATWVSTGIAAAKQVGIRDTSATFDVQLAATSSVTLTSNRKLIFDVANGARTLKLTGNATLNQDVSTTGAPAFAGLTINGNGSTTGTFTSNTTGGLPIVQQTANPGTLANNGTSNVITLNGGQMARIFACNFINGSTITEWTEAMVLWDGISTMTFANVANGSGGGIALQQSGTSGTVQVKNTTGGNINLLWRVS